MIFNKKTLVVEESTNVVFDETSLLQSSSSSIIGADAGTRFKELSLDEAVKEEAPSSVKIVDPGLVDIEPLEEEFLQPPEDAPNAAKLAAGRARNLGFRHLSDHLVDQIIGEPGDDILTRRGSAAADRSRELGLSSWPDQNILDADIVQDGSKDLSTDSSSSTSTESEFFVAEKELRNGNSALEDIMDVLQIVPRAGVRS
ncbi:hypothetical protein KSP39_PZI004018 [Platanthera zijinensis]|uniref:Uncharacterized protein n=1 Tax=Platanthera zijinensis TaxID=2320716 RepID=A0AAP0GCQ3_9ASPA